VGRTASLRMAVVSCSNHAAGYFNAYARIAQRADLDLVMHLGDYLYEYGAAQYGNLRTPEPATEMVTLADYRMRHAQYKRDADSQAMHRQHPLIAIWDDHETANNAWKDGAENHTNGAEGAWADRVAAALQAYYEWMPVRMTGTIRQHPRQDNRNFRFGKLLNLLMLEERLNARSEQLPQTHATALGPAFLQSDPGYADPERGLLGADEEIWLTNTLRQSSTIWKVLGQGVMFAQLKAAGYPNAVGGGAFLNSDQWDGYQPARDRIYSAIKGTDGGPKVSNVVVLTGDIHSAWAADLTQDPNNPDTSTGGYNPATGEGSVAVEFVGTSVTSPGVDDPGNGIAGYLMGQNPHFKHIDLNHRGYMLLDVTPARVNTEYWMLDTVAARSAVETFSVAFQVAAGSAHLTAGSQTTPKADPPPLAP
jgi:alkaline phosphatase D